MNPSCMRDFVSSRALRIISRAPWYSLSRVFVSQAIPSCIALRAIAVASRAKPSSSSIAAVCDEGEFPFLRVLVRRHFDIFPVTADDPLRVDEDQVFRFCTGLDQELRGPDVGGPCADERDRDVGHLLPHDLERVDQTGDVDRLGALLVVVPHPDLTLLPEPLQNR